MKEHGVDKKLFVGALLTVTQWSERWATPPLLRRSLPLPESSVFATLDAWAEQPDTPFLAIRHDVISCHLRGKRAGYLALLEAAPNEFGLAAVCSFSPDGYVRARAIQNLSGLGERALPFLILRTQDWVVPVQMYASHSLSQLGACSEEALAACLSTLLVIKSPAVLKAAKERDGFLSRWRFRVHPRTTCALLAEELMEPNEDWVAVLAEALNSPHQRVAQAAVHLMNDLSPSEVDSLFENLRGCRLAAARCVAMRIAHNVTDESVLMEGIFDRNWRVRNDARYYLGKREHRDFADLYRKSFPALAAIEGFSEVAKEAELAELLPFLTHASPRVRCAVIRVIAHHRLHAARTSLDSALTDPSASVVREAVRGLQSLGAHIPSTDLGTLLRKCSDEHLRRALMNGLRLVPWWDRLRLILQLGEEGIFDDVPTLVSQCLSDHPNHVVPVATTHLDQIEELLARVQAIPNEVRLPLVDEIHFARRTGVG